MLLAWRSHSGDKAAATTQLTEGSWQCCQLPCPCMCWQGWQGWQFRTLLGVHCFGMHSCVLDLQSRNWIAFSSTSVMVGPFFNFAACLASEHLDFELSYRMLWWGMIWQLLRLSSDCSYCSTLPAVCCTLRQTVRAAVAKWESLS
jgi:hypothetical protein